MPTILNIEGIPLLVRRRQTVSIDDPPERACIAQHESGDAQPRAVNPIVSCEALRKAVATANSCVVASVLTLRGRVAAMVVGEIDLRAELEGMPATRPGYDADVIVISLVIDLVVVGIVADGKSPDRATNLKSRQSSAGRAGAVQPLQPDGVGSCHALIKRVL